VRGEGLAARGEEARKCERGEEEKGGWRWHPSRPRGRGRASLPRQSLLRLELINWKTCDGRRAWRGEAGRSGAGRCAITLGQGLMCSIPGAEQGVSWPGRGVASRGVAWRRVASRGVALKDGMGWTRRKPLAWLPTGQGYRPITTSQHWLINPRVNNTTYSWNKFAVLTVSADIQLGWGD
jgi:hypothetical protein